MKLLIEQRDNTSIQVINESADKKYYIEGIFLQTEIKNNNGRIYPREIVLKEVNRYIKEKIDKNRAVGELGHPEEPGINLDKVSHKIESLKESGNDFIGKARILDTPYGKIVKNLIDEGVNFGVSSRGLGSLKNINGKKVVCDDYYIVTPADIVSDPSAPAAYVNGLMEEKEWAWYNGNLILHEKAIKNKVNYLSRTNRLDDKALLQIFEECLNRF